MDRSDFSVLPIQQALAILSEVIAPRLPAKLIHTYEKVSDADLVALAGLRFVRKVRRISATGGDFCGSTWALPCPVNLRPMCG